VIRILGVGIVLASFNAFYRALITKKLMFKSLFKLTITGTVISSSIGIYMAYKGFGVWALVTQNLLAYFINSLMFIFKVKWKPRLYFSWSRFVPMFKYGLMLMLSGLFITVYTDAVSMSIGNKFESEQLAYYKKGMMFPQLIVTNVLSALNTALFPIMSKSDDIEETRLLVRKCNQMSAFIITPIPYRPDLLP